MKFKVSILTLMLAMFTSFAFANTSVDHNEENTPIEMVTDLNLDNVSTVSISFEEEACTVTVEISVLGQSGSISATADTCAEAVAEVKKGLQSI